MTEAARNGRAGRVGQKGRERCMAKTPPSDGWRMTVASDVPARHQKPSLWTRDLAFELREVAADCSDVEASQNGFFRLALEQKLEAAFHEVMRPLARRQASEELRLEDHGMDRLGTAAPDAHLQCEGASI